MENHYYLASANTGNGFTNYFNYINPDENSFTYILKGGPGTGKSSFMKYIGEYFNKLGYNIEFFYCSSDSDSLDGIRIVEKNIAIVDGTAPHVTEATIPGVKEKILNLGDFINPKIKKHKNTIKLLLDKKINCFKIAYSYLSALKAVLVIEQQISNINKPLLNDKNNIKIQELLSKFRLLLNQKNTKTNNQRKLFLNYFSNNTICSLKDKNNFKHIVNLDNPNYFAGANELKFLENFLKENNLEFTTFFSILDPNLIDAIYIPFISTIIVNNTTKQKFANKKIVDSLIKKISLYITKAKFYHKKVEKFYISNMDFNQINILRDNIIKEIESSG